MAKPGAFWDAMVTRKKGTPMLIRLVNVKVGAINVGITTERVNSFVTTSPPAQATILPTSNVATMA